MILFVFYLVKQIVLMLFYMFKLAFTAFLKMLDICDFLFYCLCGKIKKELKKNEDAKLLKIASQSDIFET